MKTPIVPDNYRPIFNDRITITIPSNTFESSSDFDLAKNKTARGLATCILINNVLCISGNIRRALFQEIAAGYALEEYEVHSVYRNYVNSSNLVEVVYKIKKNVTYWELHGKIFGYPKCCIKYFTEVEPKDRYPTSESKFQGSGFVPCPCCKDKSIKEVVWNINHHRDDRIERFRWRGQ